MKKVILITALALCSVGLSAQGKYKDVLNSRKLAAQAKTVKKADMDDYFQQYYWLTKMEELKNVPHLKGIKPVVLYNFVKQVNPKMPTKTLTPEELKLRQGAGLALTQLFINKDYSNPVVAYNIETYVDPSGKNYFTHVNPERIKELVPKTLYYFASTNKKLNEEKGYYLWINEDDFEIVNLVPDAAKNKDFYADLNRFVPGYTFSKMLPSVRPGDKSDKFDADFFYITPYQDSSNNIVYRTKNFKDYEAVRYKTNGGEWTEMEKRKRR